jgi:hypothetical protein
MSANGQDHKPKKFFGLTVSDSMTYVIIVILTIIFIRQVAVLF